MWWGSIRGTPKPCKKKTGRTPPPTERGAGPRHDGGRMTAHLRYDPTHQGNGPPNSRECSPDDGRAVTLGNDCTGHAGFYRWGWHLCTPLQVGMDAKLSASVPPSIPVMTRAIAYIRCMYIHLRESNHCPVRGCTLIRDISQENLPRSLDFFEFVYNEKKRQGPLRLLTWTALT